MIEAELLGALGLGAKWKPWEIDGAPIPYIVWMEVDLVYGAFRPTLKGD